MAAHKRLILLIMIVMFAVVPCFANMPVIDITAITQAIASYYQTISQWQSQLQQWKSEFDRIEKAAQGIANGDYMQVLSSIASLSGQISSWNISKTAFNSALIDKAFESTSDSTYSLLNIISNSKLLVSNFDSIIKLIESKAEKFSSTIDTAQDKVAVTGSYTLDTYSDMLSMIKTLLLKGGNIGTEVANMYNNLADIFNVTPAEYASLLTSMKEKQLSSVGVTNADGVADKISAKSQELSDAKKQLANTSIEEEPTKYAQIQQQIETLQQEIDLYNDVYDWVTEVDQSISEVEAKQQEYELKQQLAENREKYYKTQSQIYKLAQELQEQEKEKMDDLYSQYVVDSPVSSLE